MITDSDLIAVVNSNDTSVVVEFYASDASPGEDGFDPVEALLCFSEIALPLMFEVLDAGVLYTRRVNSYGSTRRTITDETNTFNVTLNNEKDDSGIRTISNFEFNTGFEGLIVVQRLISRSLSTTYQKSLILFAGRCERPKGGSKESLTINASQIISTIDGEMPRRKYSDKDPNGIDPTNPNFEGFRYMPQYGVTTYSPRQKRSGWWFLGSLAGLLLTHDKAAKTLQWSSFSDTDADSYVPFGFGRVQVAGTHLAYADVGRLIYCTTAFLDEKIEAFESYRTDDLRFVVNFTVHKRYGYPAGEGPTPYEQVPVPIDPTAPLPEYPGNGYYANTVMLFTTMTGTNNETVDPAPALIIIALARLVATPDADGHWSGENWSDNPADLAYEVMTDPHYGKLDPSWIDEPSWLETHQFNSEPIYDKSFADSIFVPDTDRFAGGGTELGRFLASTSNISANYLKYLNGDATPSQVHLTTSFVQKYEPESIPVEPTDPGDGGGVFPGGGGIDNLGSSYTLKRRYTSSVLLTDNIKITDFLHNVVFTAARMYMTQMPNGKTGLKNKKPVDFGLALAEVSGDTADIDNIFPWIADKRGYALVDPNTAFSEASAVTDAVYLSSKHLVFSSTTSDVLVITDFADGDLTADPSEASLNVATVTPGDVLDFTLEQVTISFIPGTDDTSATVAGFIAYTINAHPQLNRTFRATWDASGATVIVEYLAGTMTFESDLTETHAPALDDPTDLPALSAGSGSLAAGVFIVGYTWVNFRGETMLSRETITLTADQKIIVGAITPPADAAVRWYCSPAANSNKLRFVLENDGSSFEIEELPSGDAAIVPDFNRTAAEIMRVEMTFSDRAEVRTGLTASNILRNSLKWRIGKEDTVNRIDFKFRDASQDFRLVELRLKDPDSIDKIHKIANKEYNGQAVDNYNQAYRISSGLLAEARDANFFYNLDADKKALLLQEGDVICVTDDGAQVYNLPLMIEEIEITPERGFCVVTFTVRKFANSLYDDSVAERQIPVVVQNGIGTIFAP